MHGTFEKFGKNDNRIQRSWSIGFFVVPTLLAIALIALAIFQPKASVWISEAAQAEFAGAYALPDAAPVPLAKPTEPVRTVRAN
jgi:hypothetical protein